MATYKLTAVNTTGALQIETDSTRVDFLIPDDISVNYDVTNSVVNIGTGAIQFQFTVANTVDSAGSPFANFAALKTFIEGIFFLIDGGVKVYRALLSQTGTSAPTAIVLENTLGEVPTFAYNSTGDYSIITVGNVFTANKTFILMSQIADVNGVVSGSTYYFLPQYAAATSIKLYSSQGGNTANDGLANTEIQILVYP